MRSRTGLAFAVPRALVMIVGLAGLAGLVGLAGLAGGCAPAATVAASPAAAGAAAVGAPGVAAAAPPAATAAPAGCPPLPAAAPAGTPLPPIELVETAPIETALDHVDLPEACSVWLAMIHGARTSIDLAQFYASNHQPSRLEPIVQALEAAVARGVRVRFLAELAFVKTYPDTLERLARAGVSLRHLDLKAVPGGGGVLHAKYFIVDDSDAFLGSQNFDWRALEHNHELGARIRDRPTIARMAAIFDTDWSRAGGEALATLRLQPSRGPITLVASPRDLLPAGVDWDLPRLVELLDGATTSIAVHALGYRADADGAPWGELEEPLIRAAQRGVQVQLMFADWSKRPRSIGGLQKLARIPNIAVRLTTIPAWSGGFLPFARVSHAKILVVDGARGWLGTSNWEKGYFYKSRNLGLLIDGPSLAGQLARFFATLWQSPYAVPVDPDARYTPPRIE
jgi:phosphatidylserine/phosphatidylglycerophosphate/cardiolipin synthase-like enzyme